MSSPLSKSTRQFPQEIRRNRVPQEPHLQDSDSRDEIFRLAVREPVDNPRPAALPIPARGNEPAVNVTYFRPNGEIEKIREVADEKGWPISGREKSR